MDGFDRERGQDPGAFLFYLKYWPSVSAHLAAGGGAKLAAHMARVITRDDIMRKLEQNPGEQIYFGSTDVDNDRSPAWLLTGQSEADFLETVKISPAVGRSKTPGPNFGKPWILGAEPFNWLMTLVIKWYHENGTEQQTRAAVMFLTLHFYYSLVYKYYTQSGGYQREAMAYAMNSLSDKFTLKQEGNMFRTLMVISWRSHLKYVGNLSRCSDKNIFDYFINMRNRLNGMMRSFRQHYGRVRAEGAYLNTGREVYDDGEQVERSTESGTILSLVDKLAQSFVGEPAPERLLDLASQIADSPKQSLRTAVNGMREREGPRVRRIFQLLLEVFFEERKAGPEDLKTRSFLAFCFALYARSNTKDGRIEEIKKILDELLQEFLPQYLQTNREATRGNFRRALYVYLCLTVQAKS